jgi:hypothetical protein
MLIKAEVYMIKGKWYLLIAVSLSILMSTAAGCITIVREAPASTPAETIALPTINSFTASPGSIDSGQRTTLSWDVSGVATVTIQPDIGTVGPSGSLQLSPPATITYTLTATNEAGSNTASVTLTVAPVIAAKPDLVITDIWLGGETVYYKIKNEGSAEAGQTQSVLYVLGFKEATTYIDPLAVGEEKTESFSNWVWPYAPPAGTGNLGTSSIKPTDVKVCADFENDIEETDKGNNCLVKIVGPTFTYDFVKNAHYATWRNDIGELTWPMVASDSKGAAFVQGNTLVMCPQQMSNGWIQGRFAEYYVPYFGAKTASREIEVPKYARFTAKVGFKEGSASTDGAGVGLGYVDEFGSVVLFPKIDIYSDGTMRVYEIDLSSLAGQKTEFILWVEAKNSPVGDCVMWVEPMIVQEM